MGKKSSQVPMKISKHEKKHNINSLIKILRPKVYITDSSNFKRLVQELTGNGKYSPVLSSPSPSTSVSLSPPWAEIDDQDHAYQENNLDLPFDSSCFSTPLEGSPESSLPGSVNYDLLQNSLMASQRMDLESTLMEMDSGSYAYEACSGMFQQEVCVYDYDLSTLI